MNLKGTFPHASKSFLTLNGEISSAVPQQNAPLALGKKSKGKGTIRGRIRVCFTGCFVRPFDTDNLAGATKGCVDTLRAVGLLPNDDPYSVELSWKQRKASHYDDEQLEIEISKP